jgi:hypothetical protein
MIVPIPFVQRGIGVATSVLALPLIARWVPMNRVYGIRTRRAFVSADNWYAINAYGGKVLLGFGLFLVAFSYLGRSLAPPATSLWAPFFLIAPLLAIIPALRLIGAYARRLPER